MISWGGLVGWSRGRLVGGLRGDVGGPVVRWGGPGLVNGFRGRCFVGSGSGLVRRLGRGLVGMLGRVLGLALVPADHIVQLHVHLIKNSLEVADNEKDKTSG